MPQIPKAQPVTAHQKAWARRTRLDLLTLSLGSVLGLRLTPTLASRGIMGISLFLLAWALTEVLSSASRGAILISIPNIAMCFAGVIGLRLAQHMDGW